MAFRRPLRMALIAVLMFCVAEATLAGVSKSAGHGRVHRAVAHRAVAMGSKAVHEHARDMEETGPEERERVPVPVDQQLSEKEKARASGGTEEQLSEIDRAKASVNYLPNFKSMKQNIAATVFAPSAPAAYGSKVSPKGGWETWTVYHDYTVLAVLTVYIVAIFQTVANVNQPTIKDTVFLLMTLATVTLGIGYAMVFNALMKATKTAVVFLLFEGACICYTIGFFPHSLITRSSDSTNKTKRLDDMQAWFRMIAGLLWVASLGYLISMGHKVPAVKTNLGLHQLYMGVFVVLQYQMNGAISRSVDPKEKMKNTLGMHMMLITLSACFLGGNVISLTLESNTQIPFGAGRIIGRDLMMLASSLFFAASVCGAATAVANKINNPD